MSRFSDASMWFCLAPELYLSIPAVMLYCLDLTKLFALSSKPVNIVYSLYSLLFSLSRCIVSKSVQVKVAFLLF